jgi:hypothetical protein
MPLQQTTQQSEKTKEKLQVIIIYGKVLISRIYKDLLKNKKTK